MVVLSFLCVIVVLVFWRISWFMFLIGFGRFGVVCVWVLVLGLLFVRVLWSGMVVVFWLRVSLVLGLCFVLFFWFSEFEFVGWIVVVL